MRLACHFKQINKRGYNQVNNSGDGRISEKNGFLEHSQTLGSQTSQNPTSLEAPENKKGSEYNLLFGDLINLPVFGSDQELIRSWIELKKSIHTKRAYTKVGEELLSFIHPKTLKDVTLPTLQHFLGTYKFKSHETIRQKVAIVQSLFSFAVKVDYLPKSPAVLLPTCLVTVIGKGDNKDTVGLNTSTTEQLLKFKPPIVRNLDPVFVSREGNRAYLSS
jgi:hypothetical protein